MKLNITLDSKEDFVKCLRNELVEENPKTGYGIKGYLEYRKNKNVRHPDDMYEKYPGKPSLAAELFQKIYGRKEPRSDTIFNCWSYFRMFVKWRLELNDNEVPEIDIILSELSNIFHGYDEIKQLFDKLADLHHSLANFMPAPVGYGGGRKRHDGKGNFSRDNDMPDVYYKRAEKDFPEMYKWINDNMERYSLEFFKEYKTQWSDGYSTKINSDDKKLTSFCNSIKDAIGCIESRADRLYCRMLNRT